MNCKDADRYLEPFGFQGFKHTDIYGIMGRFLVVAFILFFLSILYYGSRLRRTKEKVLCMCILTHNELIED